jgi:hypothetical protein
MQETGYSILYVLYWPAPRRTGRKRALQRFPPHLLRPPASVHRRAASNQPVLVQRSGEGSSA